MRMVAGAVLVLASAVALAGAVVAEAVARGNARVGAAYVFALAAGALGVVFLALGSAEGPGGPGGYGAGGRHLPGAGPPAPPPRGG